LIRGFDPFNDALDFGRRLLPLVRQAANDRGPITAAAE
jgi:hypothetical protein